MYYITSTLVADPKQLNLIDLCKYATFKYCSQKFYFLTWHFLQGYRVYGCK